MKTVAAFALGFVAGIVFLAAVLWSTGSLVTHAQAGRTVQGAIQFKGTALRTAHRTVEDPVLVCLQSQKGARR
jgi:hypothetical protein